jgi:hypothetical protein
MNHLKISARKQATRRTICRYFGMHDTVDLTKRMTKKSWNS